MELLSSIRIDTINPHMASIIRDLHESIDYGKWNGCNNITIGSSNCVECFRLQYFDGNTIDYNCEQKRKIYVLKFLPVHVHEVYIAIKKIKEDILEIISSKNEINILSIGGGPGSDILAIKSFIAEQVKEECMPKFNILRIDKENGWDNLSEKIVHPNFSSKFINGSFNNRKFLFNFTLNKLNKNLSFDIILISYLISEISDNDMFIFTHNMQKLLANKSVLIINDRDEYLVQNRILGLLNNLSLKPEKNFVECERIWCGFSYPDDIKTLINPKLKTNSKQHSVLIKK
jgi:ribosomal protein RSM22 (predicted rRNA methylase)